jgi:serine/threonine-protein kinase
MAAWNPRANEIFAAALEMSGAERQAYLEQTCSSDNELRRQVEAMLAAHAQAGSFLDQPVGGEWLSTATVAPSSGPPLPATGSVVQALSGPGVDLPGRYQMEEEIARGGMGAVLRGRDTELKREIAVKVLLETHAGRTEFVQRFVEEAQIAGQLQHPGVAPVYDVGTATGKRPYFTMKLVKGQTLAALLGARGDKRPACRPVAGQQPTSEPLMATDRPRLLKVFETVCQTLAYAHAHGVIHRDLKPANIMVGAFGEVQVMDWGLAKVLASGGRQPPEEDAGTIIATARSDEGDSDHTQAGTAMGTPAYMAPEQARGEVERIDERADVFGLGALLCEILTGKPPFPGKSKEAMRAAQKADLSDALQRLDTCGADGELIALAKRCLAAEPEDRPRQAGEVADAMTAYLESVEVRLRQAEVERAQAQVKAVEERKRRRLTLALAASVLLTVVLGGGGYGWMQQQRAARRAETARKVDEALEKAAVQRGRAAAAAVGDLSSWVEAQAEVQRALDLLDPDEPDPTLHERIAAVHEEIEQGRAKAERDARDAEAERRLVARLEALRSAWGDDLNLQRLEGDYAAAFRSFGLDLDTMEPKEVGTRLKGRPAAVEIAAALDHWCNLRRRQSAGRRSGLSWRRLAGAASVADPDPWRNQLRELLRTSAAQSVATLKKQADDVRALERQPAASLVLLANLLSNAGEEERSAAVLRLAWRRFPDDFEINCLLGLFYFRGQYKQPEEAVRFVTAAVAARPRSAQARGTLGECLAEQGKLDEAITVFRQAVALDPNYAAAYSSLGNVLARQGKLDEAIASFHRSIECKPRSASAHAGLGRALEKQGKVDEAVACLRRAIQYNPTSVQGYNDLGNILLRQRKFDEAVAVLRQSIEIDPKNPFARTYLAFAWLQQGRLVRAVTAFRQAIKINPKFNYAYFGLGMALFEQGQLDEAIAAYRQAIALDPMYAGAYINLGVLLCDHKHDYEAAVAVFRQAIKLQPQDAGLHDNLGVALRNQGKLDEARAAFRAVISIDPTRARAHLQLGQLLDDQGLLDEAIASFEKVVALDPRNTWAHNNLGWGLFRKGKIDEAIACYRKAIALDPSNATAHNNLGWAYQRMGKLQEAEKEYRKALEIDPKYARARTNLSSVRRLIAVEPKLAGWLEGKYKPVDNEERLAFALACATKQSYLAAARLYRDAFAADAMVADDLKAWHRYNAACCAALAVAGKGTDKPDDKQRVRWRRQALTWLRADLARYQQLAAAGKAADRALVVERMRHWQADSDLAGLRDKEALAKLPADERQAWEKLWADVEVLLRQARAKPVAK